MQTSGVSRREIENVCLEWSGSLKIEK